MQQFFGNRYVQLVGLTIGLAVLFNVIIWFVMSMLGLAGFPAFIQLLFSLLAAGLVVNKFFAGRIF